MKWVTIIEIWYDSASECRRMTCELIAMRWAIPYILIGAVIVAPVWLAMTAWKAIRRR